MQIVEADDDFVIDPIEAEKLLASLNDLLDATTDDTLRDILDDACAEIALLLDPGEELEAEAA